MNSSEEETTASVPPNLAEQPPQGGDISKNAILVLLVLTIFVSAFGTWVVLNATENIGVPTLPTIIQKEPAPTIGELMVSIIRSEDKPVPPQPKATGYLAVDIIRK